MRKKFPLYCALAFMATLYAGGAFAQGQPPAPVETDQVREEPLAQTAPVIGRIVARQRGVVSALTRGPVANVLVSVGERVEEGDVLVELAQDRLQETVNVAEASVARQRAALSTAQSQEQLLEQELARLDRLKGSPAFSQARYDDKLREVQTARARVNEARAAIDSAAAEKRLAEIDLDLAIIRAPYDGVVIARQAVRGSYANVGEPMVTLLNDKDLEIEADIPARLLAGLTKGRAVEAILDGAGGKSVQLAATVRAVIPEENALTKTRAVRFKPDMAAGVGLRERQLAVGSSLSVLVPVGEARSVVTVHKDAVLPQGGTHVFVVEENQAMKRAVRVSSPVGNRLIVEQGLKPGDVVVVMGNERLRPGQAVAPKASEASQSSHSNQPQG